MTGRILIQDVRTRHYLGTQGEWTTSCQDAKLFEQTYVALLQGLEYAGALQVVWCFRDPSRNMYVLVRPDDQATVLPCETCPLATALELGSRGPKRRAIDSPVTNFRQP